MDRTVSGSCLAGDFVALFNLKRNKVIPMSSTLYDLGKRDHGYNPS